MMQRMKIGRVLAELDRHLKGPEYVCGKDFTVVDAYMFTILRWCTLDKVKIDLGSFPHVRDFVARVATRPAVREALAAEGLTQ
jgi:glutathione S-transferase